MRQYDIYFVIKDNMLIRVIENDAHTYLRKGPQTRYEIMCSVEEAVTRFPEELKKAEEYVNY